MSGYFPEYTWIFGLTVVFAFLTAFGIGANDLANSFATSLGSKALTLGWVVIIAGICEFLGAVLLGAGVTSTIKSGIADLKVFADTPVLLLYGFLCVSVTTATWDNLATLLSLPVSTSHTVVGAVLGMALSLRGGSGVVWCKSQDDFPYIKGMVPVLLSWVVSPIMSGIICTILFFALRVIIFRSREHGYKRAFWILPILVGGIAWLIVAFIIQTGSKNATWKEYSDSFAVWVGAVAGAVAGLFTLLVIMPILRRNINRAHEAGDKLPEGVTKDSEALQLQLQSTGVTDPLLWIARKIPQGVHNNVVWRTIFWNFYQDIHSDATSNEHVKNMHDSAEVFDPKVEALFRYLQVFSAAVMSFTHGANDVANAMGPFSAVYTIWSTGQIESKVSVQTWILVIGGLGLVLGIALFSSNISRSLGVRVCKVTYCRGFCAEFATATTVAIASRYGLPVSTTQTITGALIFLGLQEGFKGVNWREVLKIFSGWVLTLFFACGISALLVALGVNSPNRNSEDNVLFARDQLLNVSSEAMLAQINAAGPTGGALGAYNTLNAEYLAAFEPQEANLTQIVQITQSVLSQFNTSLAFNPYTSTAGTLVP